MSNQFKACFFSRISCHPRAPLHPTSLAIIQYIDIHIYTVGACIKTMAAKEPTQINSAIGNSYTIEEQPPIVIPQPVVVVNH